MDRQVDQPKEILEKQESKRGFVRPGTEKGVDWKKHK